MTIKNSKLRDLFERYMNFINSNYIYAIVNETTNTVNISYPGELARIFIKIDNEISSIVVKITQDPTKKMSQSNGKIYYLSTIDELNTLIAASKVIMDLRIPETANSMKMVETALDGQGYLLDASKNVIGVVNLNLIPTNAFVYEADKINEINNDIVPEKNTFRRTISKFFS